MNKKLMYIVIFIVGISFPLFANGKQDTTTSSAGRWQDNYPDSAYISISSQKEIERISRNQFFLNCLKKILSIEIDAFEADKYTTTIYFSKKEFIQFPLCESDSHFNIWSVVNRVVDPKILFFKETGNLVIIQQFDCLIGNPE